jgi:AcrR family transcriptional regulator
MTATSQAHAPGRARNRRGEGALLREEIVEAALVLLAESGDVGEIRLRAVARKVGIAATSIYLHFPDVESLVEAALDRAFDEFDAARDAAAAHARTPAGILHARARAYCRFALEHPGLYRTMFQVDRPSTPRGRASFATLVQAIERCQEAGASASRESPRRLAALVWAALHGLVSLRITRAQFDWPSSLERDVDRVVDLIVELRR